MTDTATPAPRSSLDEQCPIETLAGYAVATAAETEPGRALTPLPFMEAELAWLDTGLLPSVEARPWVQAEIDQIVKAIVARTAAVLVLSGWKPPAESPEDTDAR